MRYTDLSSREYAELLSSSSPVPGGGGTAALCGALGCALGQMVGSLTSGKKRYAAVEEELQELMRSLENMRAEMLALTERDPEVFEPLSRAYGMPKETEEQAAEKARVMEECLVLAASVPEEILSLCGRAMDAIDRIARIGSPLAVSDAGCAAALTRAAGEAAYLNIAVNAKYMKNRAFAEELSERSKEALAALRSHADKVYANVAERIGG